MQVRKDRRIRLNLPVEVHTLPEESSKRSKGMLHDLSPGGCSLFSESQLPVGNRVQVRIHLNEKLQEKFGKEELTARGAVIRSIPKGEGYLITLRFMPAKSSR